MKTETYTLTTRDGLYLPGQAWIPENQRAVIALVHGLGEHSGRYLRFGASAAARGIAVATMDLRGHGRSPGNAAYIQHFSQFLLDVDALIAKAHEIANGCPVFLMGHSMGGAISVRWVAERQPTSQRMEALILSSALLKVGKDISKGLQLAAPVISQIAPHLRLTPLDPNSISRDPMEVSAYKSDPLVCHRAVPARTGAELLWAIEANHVATKVLTNPLYIFHGSADTLTDPDGSRDIYREWGGEDKTLRIWHGSMHETLNDLDREQVMAELFDWVVERLRPGRAAAAKVAKKSAAKPIASDTAVAGAAKAAAKKPAAKKAAAPK